MSSMATKVQLLLLSAILSLASAVDDVQDPDAADNSSDSSDDFPGDGFTDSERIHGAIVVHIFITLYFFIVIAYVCKDYFLPSVDCICQDLNLSQEVAGATFMALATSTPELFVNIIGTFITESDLGVGTVVGSAVFNIFGVPACGGLAATSLIRLNIYALLRDGTIYIIVVSVLTIILWDSTVYWYECLVLLILYAAYFAFMFCEKKILPIAQRYLKRNISIICSSKFSGAMENYANNEVGDGTYKKQYLEECETGVQHTVYQNSNDIKKSLKKSELIESTEVATEKVSYGIFSFPKSGLLRCWWLFTLPANIILWLSIPNCNTRRKLYPLTFLMCVAWFGISSYFVSWMMAILGDTFDMGDSLMGITFIAIGGSIPEISNSIINAQKGIGSMSISNALGCNTLDILLCLGLPWMIRAVLTEPVIIQSPTIAYNNSFQIVGVLVLFLTAFINNFYFNRTLGVVCLVLYLIFIAFVIFVSTV